ncbi:MAG: carbohydrate binding family 9 domain-containing protein [Acidobacteria bacterium]|nr:carbohydrate binding family 9 domain-containing protein [Acidobacteriota bacterium]
MPPDSFGAGGATRIIPVVTAAPTDEPPLIDGHLDEEGWRAAPIVASFTQRDPEEGAAGSERTEVRVLYDDHAIYVGARLFDRSPVTTRLGRRDMTLPSSDWFRVSFDSYLDRRTAYRFDVNPSGVRRDGILGGEGSSGGGFTGPEGDLAWDAVWDARTSVDADGWTAELRIPFSQLRFVQGAQTWGVQFERVLDRRQELALFSFARKSEPGGVAAFGHLTGLPGLRPGQRLEVMPYMVSEADFVDAGDNPFRSNREVHANAGVDARYAITSNLTLTTTVNPDFGQVEVDPAVINLTAFETRYDERRPFFVEGAASFRFAGALGGPSALAQGMFYSRRIGRAPQLGLSGQADVPDTARILGAAKVTGKTSNGWSVGLLNAVTGSEDGRFLDADGRVSTALTEPLTNYFVGRLNREMRAGQTTFGPIFTAVTRDVSDPRAASALHSAAYAGGVDVYHEWANRSWNVGAFAVGSHVTGTPDAIARTQRSSTRYFQRPDAASFGLDPFRTSLNGFAASVQFRKVSGTHWTGDGWVATTSPGFEMNDAGFQQRADRHAAGGGIRYQQLQPGSFFRSWNVFTGNDFSVNWDGDLVDARNFVRGQFQHLSYWTVSAMIRYEPKRMDDRFTRGGPLAVSPRALYGEVSVTSDPRKTVGGNLLLSRWRNRVGGRIDRADLSVSLRTSPQWNLTFGPSLTRARQDAQYVTSIPDAAARETFGTRYVFAPLDQRELGLVTRLNYTFTRDLTLELYMQPLVSHAVYGAPKEFLRPSAYDFATYGQDLGTVERDGRAYAVTVPRSGGVSTFAVPDRSFTTRSLRGNAVVRWEYRPGSTLFFVWQQERANRELMDDFGFDRALGSLFEARSNNVFVVKWSYWFNP